ncbi:unnamed protein product [Penicillium roqueforti FM164]|uniref:Uncharacterized protein n=1 Tax=Penicillium roqueforti (strain FM164) TaxID=1365484 RepID=W6QWF1_PENRF|nr:unnamed protein product [Penicillium roqueforti FM164]
MDAPASHSPSGRTNKRKRGAPDPYKKPVGIPGSTKQVTKTISIGAEYYMIKSAGKIRLEEEHRFLQGSNKWLVGENEKLQECYNNQELLL